MEGFSMIGSNSLKISAFVFAIVLLLPLVYSFDCTGKTGSDYIPMIRYFLDVKENKVFVDASHSITPTNTYLSYEWDFNSDGFPDATGPSATYTYPPTQYPDKSQVKVSLRVRDSCGNSNRAIRAVTISQPQPVKKEQVSKPAVTNKKPIAYFVTVVDKSNVKVDASMSYDPDGKTLEYEWDWESNQEFDDNGMYSSHHYPKNGVYLITLKVTDDKGEASTFKKSVSIREKVALTPISKPTGLVSYSFLNSLMRFFSSLFG